MKIKTIKESEPPAKAKIAHSNSLRIGLTYNLKRVTPAQDGHNDHEAEFDSEATIEYISNAITSLGHEVVKIEADVNIISRLSQTPVDLIFNIAEGVRGRGRESLVPAVLDLLDIEYTGSDATTMAVTLDKFIAKKIILQHGLLTAKSFLMSTIKDKIPAKMKFPMIMKPVAEGSSKGISVSNVVENAIQLRERASNYLTKYSQPLLVEEYISGREFTVGLLGNGRLRVLPIMEVKFLNQQISFPVYSFEYKIGYSDEITFNVPAQISEEESRRLQTNAKLCFQLLGCRDVARIDFRIDAKGDVYFIECNPLPGLVPNWSDLCLMASKGNIDYTTLIGTILAPAIKRLRQKRELLNSAPDKKMLSEAA